MSACAGVPARNAVCSGFYADRRSLVTLELLGEYRLYPAALKQVIAGGLPEGGARYLGDVN